MELRESGSGRLLAPVLKEEQGEGKWRAEVWRLDQVNLNGRVYSTALAKKVIENNPITMAYDGHEADYKSGAEYGCAKAVCYNPVIEDHILMVDIDFVDKAYESLLKELVSKGIEIGVSSYGWGEVDESGMVIPETFELVRYLDFVTMPAGQVHAKYGENKEQNDPAAKSLDEAEKAEIAKLRAEVAHNLTDYLIRR